MIVTYDQPKESGGRTGWARTFSSLNKEVKGAKAFCGGKYLDNGENKLSLGTLVVQVWPEGSVRRPYETAQLYKVTDSGLKPVSDEYEWRPQFYSLLEVAESLLGESDPLGEALDNLIRKFGLEAVESRLAERRAQE